MTTPSMPDRDAAKLDAPASPIIRGESESVGPRHVERTPIGEALHETALMGVMVLALVICCGGVGAPFVLVGWRLGAFVKGGTGPGIAFAATGLVLALSLGVALVDPMLNWLMRRLHLNDEPAAASRGEQT